jgi:uroporphyrinogen decarboxylase
MKEGVSQVTSRSLLKAAFLRRDVDRIPFIPFICGFAARLRGVSMREMLSDPTILANSLQGAVRLFDYDGVISAFDLTLEAEACGGLVAWPDDGPPRLAGHPLGEGSPVGDLDLSDIGSKGRIPVVMEATRRLKAVLGGDKGVIGVLSGPLTLFEGLRGAALPEVMEKDEVKAREILRAVETIATAMIRLYGETQVDAVMVVEERLSPREARCLDEVLPVYHSLWNIAGFYNARSILLCGEAAEGPAKGLRDIGADCLAPGEGAGASPAGDTVPGKDLCLGIGIPVQALFGSPQEVKEKVRESLEWGERRGFFLCTDWEVPCDAPVEGLHAVMEALREQEG